MITIHFLLAFLAGECNFFCVRHDHKIAQVLRAVVNGFVLPHDNLHNLGCELARDLTLGVYKPPTPYGRVPMELCMAAVQHCAHHRRGQRTLIQVDIALVSALILAVILFVRERLPQPLLTFRRLDQCFREVLNTGEGLVSRNDTRVVLRVPAKAAARRSTENDGASGRSQSLLQVPKPCPGRDLGRQHFSLISSHQPPIQGASTCS
mmetsp:Transcript_88423/g.143173  ORF Transcript_88423/g.143173 Transcript_88423/m.143173 type:complete len:207 (-) Transcript_88423:26-646(-)